MVQSNHESIISLLNDKECLICMTEFASNQKILFCPHSHKHYFHSECLVRWFKTSKACPKCNTLITLEYISSCKEEYNIRVIEKKLLTDKECEQDISMPKEGIKERLNQNKISIIVATKSEDNLQKSITEVISLLESQEQLKASLEPFAYEDRSDKLNVS